MEDLDGGHILDDLEVEDSENGNEVVNEEEDDDFSFETTIAEAVLSMFWGDRNQVEDDPEGYRSPLQTRNAIVRNELGFPGLFYERTAHPKKIFLKEALDRNISFNHWTESQKIKLASSMKRGKFFRNKVALAEGDVGCFFYVIEEGHLRKCSQKSDQWMVYGEYSSFGEVSLLSNFASQYSYLPMEDCTVWRVEKNTFLSISSENSREVYERNQSGLLQFEFFNALGEAEISAILDKALYVRYRTGDPIYNDNDSHSFFYIILTGAVEIVHNLLDGSSTLLRAGKCFGYAQMFEDEGALRNESATAVHDCDVFVLNKVLFDHCFDAHKELFNN